MATGANHSIVVAIDYGTAYSGYAYSKLSQNPKIYMNKTWPSKVHRLDSWKTPTSILFEASKSKELRDPTFHSFGYDAENSYMELKEDGKDLNQWYFFQGIKMELYQKKVINVLCQVNVLCTILCL